MSAVVAVLLALLHNVWLSGRPLPGRAEEAVADLDPDRRTAMLATAFALGTAIDFTVAYVAVRGLLSIAGG